VTAAKVLTSGLVDHLKETPPIPKTLAQIGGTWESVFNPSLTFVTHLINLNDRRAAVVEKPRKQHEINHLFNDASLIGKCHCAGDLLF